MPDLLDAGRHGDHCAGFNGSDFEVLAAEMDTTVSDVEPAARAAEFPTLDSLDQLSKAALITAAEDRAALVGRCDQLLADGFDGAVQARSARSMAECPVSAANQRPGSLQIAFFGFSFSITICRHLKATAYQKHSETTTSPGVNDLKEAIDIQIGTQGFYTVC